MVRTSKDKTISIRLSQSMLEALDARAVLDDKDRAQVIRDAISRHLDMDEDLLEEKVNSLEQSLNMIHGQYQRDKKKVEVLEKRIDEISRLVAYCLERLPSGKT